MKNKINLSLRILIINAMVFVSLFVTGFIVSPDLKLRFAVIIGFCGIILFFLSRIVLNPIMKLIEKTKESGLEVIKVDQQIRELNQQLEEANKIIVNLNIELKQKNEELEAFIYSISHDLRSPLTGVGGFASLLLKTINSEDKESRIYATKIRDNTVIMNNMITNLLELSRIGRTEEKKEAVDMNSILEKIKQIFFFQMEKKNIKFVVKEPVFPVYANPDRIIQIMVNLVSNAVKFNKTEREAFVEIGMEKTNDNIAKIYVKDNGIGINKEFHSKIFQMYSRVKDVEVEGSGIGLAIVKKIVENYGGKIWIESEKDKGTTFFFTIPAAK